MIIFIKKVNSHIKLLYLQKYYFLIKIWVMINIYKM